MTREWTKEDSRDYARFKKERREAHDRANQAGLTFKEALPPEVPSTPIGQLYRLTSQALNVLLFRLPGLTLASTLGDARRELLAFGGGNTREMYRRLRGQKNVGPKTANLLCSVLGLDGSTPARHCPTCTCQRH